MQPAIVVHSSTSCTADSYTEVSSGRPCSHDSSLSLLSPTVSCLHIISRCSQMASSSLWRLQGLVTYASVFSYSPKSSWNAVHRNAYSMKRKAGRSSMRLVPFLAASAAARRAMLYCDFSNWVNRFTLRDAHLVAHVFKIMPNCEGPSMRHCGGIEGTAL